MPYSTKTGILKQISEEDLIALTDDTGTGMVDDSVVNKAIQDADGEINSYCKKKYEVPFNPVPDMINKLSVDISIYHLYSRRQNLLNESVTKRYDDAIKFLKDVARGVAEITDVPPPATDSDQVGKFQANDRLFTRENMEDL